MSSKNQTQSKGIGLMSMLFVLFLALKLIGIAPVATWSWWWITAPLWADLAFCIVVLMIAALILD